MTLTKDICKNKHRGNRASIAAHARVAPCKEKQRQLVLAACNRRGGLTCRELAAEWGVPMHTISGRFSELKEDGIICTSGRRDGCGIHYLTS